MSFRKIESNWYCVGGKHRSATTNIYEDITCKCGKVLIGHCSIYSGKKSTTVTDETKAAEVLGDFWSPQAKKDLLHQKWCHNCFQKSRKSFGKWS